MRRCQFLRLACLFMLMTAGHGWGSVTPWEIEVKGIVTVLDDRRVFITTHDPAGGEKSYMLAEGQSCGGITLLSVDVKNNAAQFDNHGTLQVLRICSTPELAVTSVSSQNQTAAASLVRPAAMGGTPAQASTTANSSNETVEGFNSDFATVVASTASSKNTSTGSGNASANSGNASTDVATGASSTSGSSSSEINAWWYGGSQDIERARLETEDAVRQGALPPYPLTPLTPPGTPTELIGPGQAFFNHFNPQYRVN